MSAVSLRDDVLYCTVCNVKLRTCSKRNGDKLELLLTWNLNFTGKNTIVTNSAEGQTRTCDIYIMFGRNAPTSPKTPTSPLRKIQKYLDLSLKKKTSTVGIEPPPHNHATLSKNIGSSSDDMDHASSTLTQIENYSAAVDSTSNLSEVTTNFAAATMSPIPNSQPLTIRTGDKASYWCSSSDNLYIEKKCSERAYRVLSYRKDKTGKRVIFDILDGKPYFLTHGEGKRITHNAIVFETRSAALSERFPSNQVSSIQP